MGTQRASNKDILDAINALTQAITYTHVKPAVDNVQAGTKTMAAPPAVLPMSQERNKPAPVVEQATETEVEYDPDYLLVMQNKVHAACKADGLDRILYARRNQRCSPRYPNGELKLAYCLASRLSLIHI